MANQSEQIDIKDVGCGRCFDGIKICGKNNWLCPSCAGTQFSQEPEAEAESRIDYDKLFTIEEKEPIEMDEEIKRLSKNICLKLLLESRKNDASRFFCYYRKPSKMTRTLEIDYEMYCNGMIPNISGNNVQGKSGKTDNGEKKSEHGVDKEVILSYPRISETKAIVIELDDNRCADDIRVSYDFERDGWLIEQGTVFEWEYGDEICDPGWKEVAFVQAWQLYKRKKT